MEIYNLIYTMTETDDPLNSVCKVRSYSTETAAQNALKDKYEKMVEDIKNGKSILDCVRKENYGNNARIELGYESQDESDAGIPEVETRHEWRITKTTLDLDA